MWLVNEVAMLLVDCQLSLVVIGCEDCTQWLVRFDQEYSTLSSRQVMRIDKFTMTCSSWSQPQIL